MIKNYPLPAIFSYEVVKCKTFKIFIRKGSFFVHIINTRIDDKISGIALPHLIQNNLRRNIALAMTLLLSLVKTKSSYGLLNYSHTYHGLEVCPRHNSPAEQLPYF